MGWRSFGRDGTERYEGHTDPELGGRPVAQGEEGNLLAIIQEDYGHKIGVDLTGGVIVIDPESWEVQNGRFYWSNPKTVLYLTDETNIAGEYKHLKQTFDLARDEKGRKIHDNNGNLVKTRTDHLEDIHFKPIWFSRFINGIPCKIVGLQATMPETQGGHNLKIFVTIYADGRLGISGG